jgi:hypothetical protein
MLARFANTLTWGVGFLEKEISQCQNVSFITKTFCSCVLI